MPHDPQTSTLHLLTFLTALRPDWAGTLILSSGLTETGADLALAANIAGGTCLSLDPSPENCRAALRTGAVDFAVNTLDEALRALKNEIRKGQPLSVALEGDPSKILPEILDRGLLPDLFTAFTSTHEEEPRTSVCLQAAKALGQQGAALVDFDGTLTDVPTAISAAPRLELFLAEHNLHLESFDFDSAAHLRSFDARVLTLLPQHDPRRRWSLAASRHFSRARPIHRRSLFLTSAEKDHLARNPLPDLMSTP